MVAGAPPARETAHQHPYRWAMLALVWVSYTSFAVVSQSPAPLVSFILRDLGLTYTQMGTILGAWPVVYIGVAYLAGAFIDKAGLRVSMGLGLVVVALSGGLRGLATGFETMLVYVALFGLGGPMISIGAPKAISLWFAGRERGVAVGFYSTALTVGSIITLATANSLVLPLVGTWRGVFLFYSGCVFAVVVLWWLAARNAPPDARAAGAHPGAGSPAPEVRPLGLLSLVRVRTVWVVLVITFGVFLVNHGMSTWLPRILQSHGMTPVDAGFWAAFTMGIGLPGVILVPRWALPGRRRRIVALALASSAVGTLAIGTLGVPLLAVGLGTYGLVRGILLPVLMLSVMDAPAVGARNMGAAAGLVFTVGEIGGFAGPFLMGLLLDMTGTFLSSLLLTSATSFAMIFMALLLEDARPSSRRAAAA